MERIDTESKQRMPQPEPKRQKCGSAHSVSEEILGIALTHSPELFRLSDLASLLATNRSFRDGMVRRDNIWKPFTEKNRLQFACNDNISITGDFDDSSWKDKNIVPSVGTLAEMGVPPRICGEERDCYSFLPHPDDVPAITHPLAPLVKPKDSQYAGSKGGLYSINKQTGAIQDMFHRASDSAGGRSVFFGPEGAVTDREQVYVDRPLPINCSKCNVTCQTHHEFVAHLKSRQHAVAMVKESNDDDEEELCEFYDPRLRSTFNDLSMYEKVRTLMEYKHMVIRTLRAPMSEESRDSMRKEVEWVVEFAERHDLDKIQLVTLQQVCRSAVRIVVSDFLEMGMTRLCLNICKRGWESFDRCLTKGDLYGGTFNSSRESMDNTVHDLVPKFEMTPTGVGLTRGDYEFRWDEVLARVKSHPYEAAEEYTSHFDCEDELGVRWVLQLVLENQAPAEVVAAVIDAFPRALVYPEHKGFSTLAWTVHGGKYDANRSPDTMRMLVRATLKELDEVPLEDLTNLRPFLFVTQYWDEGLSIDAMKIVLEEYPALRNLYKIHPAYTEGI